MDKIQSMKKGQLEKAVKMPKYVSENWEQAWKNGLKWLKEIW